jgi:hypothetical protein
MRRLLTDLSGWLAIAAIAAFLAARWLERRPRR